MANSARLLVRESPLVFLRYPTNTEHVQVVPALMMKNPFLRGLEGNGYHTWHQSLKRKSRACTFNPRR
ncbi:hypothetical protein KUCAC02_020438 [Chaenocephalus aceratus]|nr:hypothetical protein KUCAC02_020438 [Chaenocephalus aceratus]